MTGPVLHDLEIWRKLLENTFQKSNPPVNARDILINPYQDGVLKVWTDASGKWGIGGVNELTGEWFSEAYSRIISKRI